VRRLHRLDERGGIAHGTVETVADNAEQAFWAEVAKSFPEAKSGDLDPMAVTRFSKAAQEAVRAWVEWNVPGAVDEDEDDQQAPDEDELRTNVTISDKRGRGYTAHYEGDEIASEEDWDDLMKAINAWMKKEQFFPSVYYVNERGNIETVSSKTGKFVGQGWV